MSGEPENLVLRAFREQREILNRINATMDDMREDMREVKARPSSLEMRTATVHNRMDRFDERLARVERRLELVEA